MIWLWEIWQTSFSSVLYLSFVTASCIGEHIGRYLGDESEKSENCWDWNQSIHYTNGVSHWLDMWIVQIMLIWSRHTPREGVWIQRGCPSKTLWLVLETSLMRRSQMENDVSNWIRELTWKMATVTIYLYVESVICVSCHKNYKFFCLLNWMYVCLSPQTVELSVVVTGESKK